MNIVVCGYKGTGKTTLSKKIASELGFEYVLHYQICKEPQKEEAKIMEFLKNGDGYVLDLLAPFNLQMLARLGNTFCIFMGFEKIENQALAGKSNMLENKTEDMILQSEKFKKMCASCGIPFFGVGTDRESVINKAFLLAKEAALKKITKT